MPDRLAVIVPTRGRPENIRRLIGAWDFTNAWDVADLILAVDSDDPELNGYVDQFEDTRHPDTGETLFSIHISDVWRPMVHKLNSVAVAAAELQKYFAIGFAGDDHVPQTIGWAQRYLTVLRELGTGMVYGDDGYQGSKLSTEWAVTADVVRALGRMVPAPVEHMYCDNAMMDVFGGAGAMRHLPEVRIEHMHPVVGKAETDEQYKRVNHRDQFHKDKAAYDRWRQTEMNDQINAVSRVRGWDAVPVPAPRDPKPSNRARGGRPMPRNSPFPHHFKRVRGATPPDIEVTLADLARQVPADQEIVELGVFQGKTSLVLAWGASQGNGAHVTGVDAWDLAGNTYDPPFNTRESERWARFNVQSYGKAGTIKLIKGFSHEVAASSSEPWFLGDRKVGLLFVDDDHSKEGARLAIEAWAPHLAPGAVIAIDDYGHPDWPGVAEAVDDLVAEGFLDPISLYHDRLAVTRLSLEGRGDQAAGERSQGGDAAPITAITSEGVEPEPAREPASPAADEPATTPDLSKAPLGTLRAMVRNRGMSFKGLDRDALIKIIQESE